MLGAWSLEGEVLTFGMDPFPDDHELISFFEVKPQVIDADVVWFYNHLTFRGEAGGVPYAMEISPSNGEVDFRIGDPVSPVVNLSLKEVSSIELNDGPAGAFMVMGFDPDSRRGMLKVRIRPKPSIEWCFESEFS